MLTIQEIHSARNQLIREIDEVFAGLVYRLESQGPAHETLEAFESYDKIYPLSYNTGFFKGKKPTGVIFATENVPVNTWKMVFKEIMNRCNADVDKHRQLMDLRSRVSGRSRAFLSDRPDGMRSPMQIDNKLYAETHYDTETLLRILLHRILDAVHYDYGNIYISIRNDG